MVNKPSVFEPLKFCCTMTTRQFVTIQNLIFDLNPINYPVICNYMSEQYLYCFRLASMTQNKVIGTEYDILQSSCHNAHFYAFHSGSVKLRIIGVLNVRGVLSDNSEKILFSSLLNSRSVYIMGPSVDCFKAFYAPPPKICPCLPVRLSITLYSIEFV